jgi:MFS transporter, DHA2 family, multidrug resistance protein
MRVPSFEAAAEAHPLAVRKWLVASAVMIGAVMTVLDTSIVNVSLPYMQKSFAADVDQITWVVTSYLVAVSVTIPMTGWCAVHFGRKRYFLASVLMFAVTSAMCGLARGVGAMVVFRLLQGAAGAAMIPLSQAILIETFPPAEHTLAMTTFGMGLMAAPVLGPTLGGWITINWNWRWVFFINVPTGVLAMAMVYAFVHDPPYLRRQRGSGRIDYLGIVLVAVALGLFQIVLAVGGRAGWFASPWVCSACALSALSAAALIFHELRFPEPLIDLRMFKVFGFTLAVAIISIQAVALFSINLLNPLFMETLLGYDAWKAGLAVAPRGLGVVIALLAVGQLSRRGIDMRPIISGGFMLAAYEVWRMSHWGLGITMSEVLWPIFFFGLGLGSVFPTVTAVGLGQIARERMGYASSLFSMMVNIGAATGIAASTNLLAARRRFHLAHLLATTPGSGAAHHPVAAAAASQAWLLAYNDVYRVLAMVVLFLAPWSMLLKRTSATVAAETVVE